MTGPEALDETSQHARDSKCSLLEFISGSLDQRAAAWAGCPGQGPLALGPCHVGTRKRRPRHMAAQGGVMRMAQTSPARRMVAEENLTPAKLAIDPLEANLPHAPAHDYEKGGRKFP